MKIVNADRCTGKSTMLLEIAHKIGYPILVKYKSRQIQLIKMAIDLGYNDVNVILYNTKDDFVKFKGRHIDKVLIDDAHEYLEDALNSYFGIPVAACTMTLPMKERLDDGY